MPWSTLNGGSFGSYSFSGIRGEFGWVIVVLAIGAIVLACLPNIAPPMNKNFSIGVIAIGILESLITIITMFRVLGASSEFGDGFSIGFGLIIAVIASIAIVITGLLVVPDRFARFLLRNMNWHHWRVGGLHHRGVWQSR